MHAAMWLLMMMATEWMEADGEEDVRTKSQSKGKTKTERKMVITSAF